MEVDEESSGMLVVPFPLGEFARVLEQRQHSVSEHNASEKKRERCERTVRMTIFCPHERLSKQMYYGLWQSISDTHSFHVVLQRVCTGGGDKELIQRVRGYNIVGSAVRAMGNRTIFYFTGRTVEGTLVLMEVIVDHGAQYNSGLLTYKSEYTQRDARFEAFIGEVLTCSAPRFNVTQEEAKS